MTLKGMTRYGLDWEGPDEDGEIGVVVFCGVIYLSRADLEAMLASYENKPLGADEEESE